MARNTTLCAAHSLHTPRGHALRRTDVAPGLEVSLRNIHREGRRLSHAVGGSCDRSHGNHFGQRLQAKRLKELEKENGKLKRLVAELSLDKQILKDIAEGNF